MGRQTQEGSNLGATERLGYRRQSVLTLPLREDRGRVVGVLELINALDAHGAVVAFDAARAHAAERLVVRWAEEPR